MSTRQRQPTKHALDAGDFAAFSSIFHSLSIPDVYALRERAKAITSELLEIVNQEEEIVIEKNINYKDAFINFDKTHPSK